MTIVIVFLFVAVLVSALVGAVCVLEGWVATKLWAWFVIPQFHLAPLPITIAIGLSLLVSVYRYSPSIPEEKGRDWKPFAMIMAKPILLLGMGWIVTLFM